MVTYLSNLSTCSNFPQRVNIQKVGGDRERERGKGPARGIFCKELFRQPNFFHLILHLVTKFSISKTGK